MRYEFMRPHQLRTSLQENWPAILPIGVLEYHGEHCPLGTDTLPILWAAEKLEAEQNVVILPAFHYGAASYAVATPENNGSVHVDSTALLTFAHEIFRGFLRVGFRNLHLFVWHQSENFANGMPTDLAFKLAARQAIFEFLEREHGEGWWGKPEMRDYYEKHGTGTSPFEWIRVHPLLDAEDSKAYPGDHAGRLETSLMLAQYPETVDMSRISPDLWYCDEAKKADADYGRAAAERILACMKNTVGRQGKDRDDIS